MLRFQDFQDHGQQEIILFQWFQEIQEIYEHHVISPIVFIAVRTNGINKKGNIFILLFFFFLMKIINKNKKRGLLSCQNSCQIDSSNKYVCNYMSVCK